MSEGKDVKNVEKPTKVRKKVLGSDTNQQTERDSILKMRG